MYISAKYKIIFIRTPKTGSSSLIDFLIQNLDDPDAIHSGSPDGMIKVLPTVEFPGERIAGPLHHKIHHMTLAELIDLKMIPIEALRWNIFTVIRDPIERQKSFYYFFKQFWSRRQPASLEEYHRFTRDGWIFERNDHGLDSITGLLQSDMVRWNETPLGDYWLYEDMNERAHQLLKDLGVELKFQMPRHKARPELLKGGSLEFDGKTLAQLHKELAPDFKLYEKLKRKRDEAN